MYQNIDNMIYDADSCEAAICECKRMRKADITAAIIWAAVAVSAFLLILLDAILDINIGDVVAYILLFMPTIQMNFMQLKNRAQKSNRMGTYNAINNQIMDLIDMLDGNYPGRLTQVQRGEFFIGYNQQMHYNRDAAIAKKREKEENTIAMSAVNTVATVDETTVA
jgi:hypothetical protein